MASALLLVASALLTGALHLDGLMDTADGLFGGRTPERRLEIMRDSRVGSFGALAGALASCSSSPRSAPSCRTSRAPALVAALVAGRCAQVLAVWLFPAARPEGLGAAYKAGVRLPSVTVATASRGSLAWLALGPAGLVLLLLSASIGLLLGRWMASSLGGGLTGDTYGALNEVAEVAVLLALVSPLPPLLALRGERRCLAGVRWPSLWWPLAFDLLWGEPPAPLHPVVWMGKAIGALERLAPEGDGVARLAYGAVLAGVPLALFVAPAVLLERALWGDRPARRPGGGLAAQAHLRRAGPVRRHDRGRRRPGERRPRRRQGGAA